MAFFFPCFFQERADNIPRVFEESVSVRWEIREQSCCGLHELIHHSNSMAEPAGRRMLGRETSRSFSPARAAQENDKKRDKRMVREALSKETKKTYHVY